MIGKASSLKFNRLLKVSAIFIVLLGLSLVVSIGANVPTIFLYVIIVLEGTGLGLWIISKVQAENSMPPMIQKEGSGKYYYYETNRAESLYQQVKSVARKSSGYAEHSKAEIARVLERILEESPQVNSLLDKEEFRIVLSPNEKEKKTPSAGKKEMMEKSKIKPDYISSLEKLISKLEGR